MAGNRRVWAFLNGEPFVATVKKGQDPSIAQHIEMTYAK